MFITIIKNSIAYIIFHVRLQKDVMQLTLSLIYFLGVHFANVLEISIGSQTMTVPKPS